MKTAILVTARLKSTRLPRKVLKFIHGRPMISHMLDRLKLATKVDEIIICTSSVVEDDPLAELAAQEGVSCYRGHPDDVLLRLTNAAQVYDVDLVINCTADNPFVDPDYIDLLVAYHLANEHDFSASQGLPFGAFAYALSRPAMEKACKIKSASDTEVWGGYFTQTGLFKWGTMSVTDERVRWPELRLTVDTPSDFELITNIFDALYQPEHIFPLQDIVTLCRQYPNLAATNAHIQQKPAKPIALKAN